MTTTTTTTRPDQPGRGAPVPADTEAEAAVLSCCMYSAKAVDRAVTLLTPGDFYVPANAEIFAAISDLHGRGLAVDGYTVRHHLETIGRLELAGGHDRLVSTVAGRDALSGHIGQYVAIVAEVATARRLHGQALELADAAKSKNLARAAGVLADLRSHMVTVEAEPAVDLAAFVAEADADADHDWLVEGLLERGDRVILTGEEGQGKSTLLRQMAVTVAGGLHPFTFATTAARRVLLVDLENGRPHLRRSLRPLWLRARGFLAQEMMVVASRPEGIDLLNGMDVAWLTTQVRNHQAEVLVIGPLYKLALGDPTEEQVAREVAFRLDDLRTTYGLAVVIEAHSPHANGGGRRPERVYGASLWMRWPEFGLTLRGSGELAHWRGQRDERDWPRLLRRGGEWPWVPADAASGPAEAGLAELVLRVVAEADSPLSGREVTRAARLAGVGVRTDTLRLALAELVSRGLLDVQAGPRNSVLYTARNEEF